MADLTKRATLIVQFKDELSAGARATGDALDRADEKANRHAATLRKLGSVTKDLAIAGFGALTAAMVASIKIAAELVTSFAHICGTDGHPQVRDCGAAQRSNGDVDRDPRLGE